MSLEKYALSSGVNLRGREGTLSHFCMYFKKDNQIMDDLTILCFLAFLKIKI